MYTYLAMAFILSLFGSLSVGTTANQVKQNVQASGEPQESY